MTVDTTSLPAEFLDAPSEFWHDVAAGKLFLRPPPGVSDPADLEDLSEKDAKLAHKLGQLQPFATVFP